MGWKAERKNAGYDPARKPTTSTITNNDGNSHVKLSEVNASCLPAIWLKSGNNSHASPTANTVDVSVTNNDSVKNCATRYLRADPSTLRTPTSFALFDDRAVKRFMKFTQAISRINMAIIENM